MNSHLHSNHLVRFSGRQAAVSAWLGAYLAPTRDGGGAIGSGGKFSIQLPASNAELAQPADATTELCRTAARPVNILVVDDNIDAVETMSILLSLRGHAVETCMSPEQALAALERFRPDVAVLDIGLPGMSGHVLAERIQAMLGDQPCRLIAQTGYGQPADIARSAAAGFEIHLVKPVDPRRLIAIIESR
jgi:CheY-like chemotaxis protein